MALAVKTNLELPLAAGAGSSVRRPVSSSKPSIVVSEDKSVLPKVAYQFYRHGVPSGPITEWTSNLDGSMFSRRRASSSMVWSTYSSISLQDPRTTELERVSQLTNKWFHHPGRVPHTKGTDPLEKLHKGFIKDILDMHHRRGQFKEEPTAEARAEALQHLYNPNGIDLGRKLLRREVPEAKIVQSFPARKKKKSPKRTKASRSNSIAPQPPAAGGITSRRPSRPIDSGSKRPTKPPGSPDKVATTMDRTLSRSILSRSIVGTLPLKFKLNYDRIVSILKTDILERKAEDLELLNKILQLLPPFKKLSEFLLMEICKVMVAEDHEGEQIIFRQGEPGDRWYVVLSGSVRVMIRRDQDPTSADESMIVVNFAWPGDSFGDSALVNDAPRAATIQTQEPTTLAVVEKSDYKRLLLCAHQIEQKYKLQFLRLRVPFFANVTDTQLKRVASRMVIRKCAPETAIVREGDVKDQLYIVKRGMCDVLRKVKLGENDEAEIFLGNLKIGDHFNENLILNPGHYSGCPITVRANSSDPEGAEIASVGVFADWTRMDVQRTTWDFSQLTNNELIKIYKSRAELQRFRKYQTQLLDQIAREKLVDPAATWKAVSAPRAQRARQGK
ncbi:uncharacterized protein BJ171DRAFT_621072 [Polychytrium aggregatum]|uniref:uncharacterized protein n=1 Tax=Polychytrium aggregatum TaxID=110093 RepID=UPI0022FEB753|nr:uncharacterized protein BJ171DRAFT_621072 [Polychytrium aggregatum]KAI9204148.1 hypothetical protein BJ171DRAFT_621072 [Polychytrium aggregatum]